jgi:hypothetical protein
MKQEYFVMLERTGLAYQFLSNPRHPISPEWYHLCIGNAVYVFRNGVTQQYNVVPA